ncbi:MAG: NAD(P)H-hydrate epimerase, partial [Pseudomonadota bacterium]
MTPAIATLMPISLFTVANIRDFEMAFVAEHPKISLMQRAGNAVAKQALSLLKKTKSAKKNVLVLVGPGNNGGDAWIAAEALRQAKCQVTILALGEQQP